MALHTCLMECIGCLLIKIIGISNLIQYELPVVTQKHILLCNQ